MDVITVRLISHVVLLVCFSKLSKSQYLGFVAKVTGSSFQETLLREILKRPDPSSRYYKKATARLL